MQPYHYPGGTVVIPCPIPPLFGNALSAELAIRQWCRERDIHVASIVPQKDPDGLNLYVCIGSGQEHMIEFALSWKGGSPDA